MSTCMYLCCTANDATNLQRTGVWLRGCVRCASLGIHDGFSVCAGEAERSRPPGRGRKGAAQPHAAAGSSSGSSSGERARRYGEKEREAPVQSLRGSRRSLCLLGSPRGTGSIPAFAGPGCSTPAGPTSAEGFGVGCTVLPELTGGGRKRPGGENGSLYPGREGESRLLPL
ncbi:hypothetical protein NQZ68_025755 [Dissostichus eleginoides]|nr:hypothetical protein NQZ68_025755 [Dissostichus eleginoides]